MRTLCLQSINYIEMYRCYLIALPVIISPPTNNANFYYRKYVDNFLYCFE